MHFVLWNLDIDQLYQYHSGLDHWDTYKISPVREINPEE